MSLNLPNFGLRRQLLKPVFFLPAEKAFEPQLEIRMLKDVTGYVGKKKDRARYHLSKEKAYMVDRATARSFVVKGYAAFTTHQPPISDDERDEAMSQITTLSLGA